MVVALTGGIGSGKTAVSNAFKALGVDVIDTDVIARECVARGEPALTAILDHFGADVALPGGALDRAKLRQKVFDNPKERAWLESLLHPIIRERAEQAVKQSTRPYCLLVIPLLTPGHPYTFVHRILVVDSDEALQRKRVMQRDSISEALIRSMMQAQISHAERLAMADDVLINNGTLEALKTQVARLHESYLKLSQDAQP